MKNNIIKQHKKTIRVHRKYVRQMCFKMGIPWLGLVHDLSKYSKTEMSIAKWYTGTSSPHDVARKELGYSPSWYHHKNKNKHHWEYWLDFNGGEFDKHGDFIIKPKAVEMPYKYVIEMFCDYIGAGKAYSKEKWTCSMPWDYYQEKCVNQKLMHIESNHLLRKLLWNLKEMGLEEFLRWYKRNKKFMKTQYDAGLIREF